MTNPFDVESGDSNPFARGGSPSAAPGRSAPPPPPPSAAPPPGETPTGPPASAPGPAAFGGFGSDLVADLENLQRHAAAMQSMVQSAVAASPVPEQASGTDRSGAITAIVGTDGQPESFRVASGWDQKLSPEQFGAAVTEAANAAIANQMSGAAEALRDIRERSDSGQAPPPSPAMPVTEPASSQFPPRPLGVIVEDALNLFDQVGEFRPPRSMQGTGHAGGGRLSVTLIDGGGVACMADPRWVSGKPGSMLANALSDAVYDARSELVKARSAAASSPGPESPAAGLQGMLGELMTLMRDPSRLTDEM